MELLESAKPYLVAAFFLILAAVRIFYRAPTAKEKVAGLELTVKKPTELTEFVESLQEFYDVYQKGFLIVVVFLCAFLWVERGLKGLWDVYLGW